MKASPVRLFPWLTIIGAILAAVLLLGSPAPSDAAEIVLVSNTSQPGISGSTSVNANDHAQAFTTGNNTLGYTLASIELDVGTAPGNGVLTVSVRAEESGSPSSTVLSTLTNPGNLGTGLREFTAPGNPTLSANTTYFVHMTFAPSGSANQPQWKTTRSTSEDSGGAIGWSISNTRQLRATGSSGNWSTNSFDIIEIKVKGKILTMAAPANLTAAVGDGQVTLSWNDPNNSSITGYRVLWMESMDKLTFTDSASGDKFGDSVGVDNKRAAVGAPLEDSADNGNTLTDSGRVHFFYRESGVWSHDGGRSFIGVSANDITGASVAVDGRTVVYGVPKYDHEVSNNVTHSDAGRMIVYIKPQGSGWGYVHDPPGKAAGDQLGRSVAVDGDTAVVGAPSTDVGIALSVGTAYVHTRGSNLTDAWSEQATLTPSTRAANDQFGLSVAVDGDTAVVGAPGRLTYTGAVYVFTRDANGNWTQATQLSIPNSQTADAFGWSVAVDGDTVVAGAWGDDEVTTQTGSAYVFTKPASGWNAWGALSSTDKRALTARLTASDAAWHDHLGNSVAMDGDTVVVGAHDDDDNGDNSGSAYLFIKPSGGWVDATEALKLTAPDGAADDKFGYSVAAGGGRAIVGAPGDENETGAAYVFSIPEWTDIPVPASNSGTMSYTVTGLDNDTGYTFWVQPVDSGGPGPISDSVTATPRASKAATPANLTALGIDREVTLSWDDPNDSSIERYRYRQKEGDGTFGSWNNIELNAIDSTSDAGKLKYTVSDLTNGTTYTFQIYAEDNHEDSEFSAEVSATPAPPPPLPPVPLYVSNIGQPTDTNVGADADLSSDQAQGFSTGGNTDDYLLGSIDLYFQSGTDMEDLTVSVWKEDSGYPDALEHTLTNPDTIEPGLVRFTVDADAELEANAHYFVHLTYSGSGTPPRLRTTTSTSEDSGAATGWTIEDFRYFPFGTGWQASVNLLKISVNQVLDPPDAPVNLEATVGDGQVVLSWDDPQDDYITKYQYSNDGGTSHTEILLAAIDSSETGKFKYTVENLTNGTTYTFEVWAVNSAGDGEASTKTVVMMPAAPVGLSAMAGDERVQLTWDDPQDDSITKYQYNTDGGASYTDIALTDIDSSETGKFKYTIEDLTNHTTYTFGVRAVNPSGIGRASPATATPVPVPAAPVNLSATPGDGEVALSWDDPGNATITKYQYRTDGGANFSDFDGGSSASTTAYTVTGLTNSTEYTLALRAVNPTGNGEASTVTALILPAKPTGLTGIEYNSQVELGWDDPNDSTITKYQLLQIAPRKLTSSDGTVDDYFGMAVAVDGDTALVGALQAYEADLNNRPGAAYVFTWNSEFPWRCTATPSWLVRTWTATTGINPVRPTSSPSPLTATGPPLRRRPKSSTTMARRKTTSGGP